MSRVTPGYFCLIRLQVVSAFESPVVTVISWVVEEWPVELSDDIISARLIFPVVTCGCT